MSVDKPMGDARKEVVIVFLEAMVEMIKANEVQIDTFFGTDSVDINGRETSRLLSEVSIATYGNIETLQKMVDAGSVTVEEFM